MKVRLLTLLALIALLVAGVSPHQAYAQAYSTSFTTSITYQNVGTEAAKISILFYPDPTSTTAIEVARPDLAPGAGTSVFIGGLSEIGDDFQGSAIMQASQPVLATLVQLPQGSTTVKNRPLSNGFSEGSTQTLIATVLRNQFDASTIFSVQNVGASSATVTIHFYNTSAAEVHTITDVAIQPGGAYYVDAGQLDALGSFFNGSAVIESSGGQLVASAMELNIAGTGASAFEGVASGATTYYMPSALCNAFGGQNTAYAVQNTSLVDDTDVTVTYSNGASQTQNVGPGAKKSFIACDASGMANNFSGAATVTSTATPVIAIGKAYGTGLSTAFVGASTGYEKLALPYVRWATDANYASGAQQRTFITVQNIGGAALPDGSVTVQYIDRDGNVSGEHTLGSIDPGAKVNSTAQDAGLAEFGVYPGGQFGGGAIVTGPAGSQLVVVARVASRVGTTTVAEDYNGMPVP